MLPRIPPLFRALLCNVVYASNDNILLISTIEFRKDIDLIYAFVEKSVMSRLEFKSDVAKFMGEAMKFRNMIRIGASAQHLQEKTRKWLSTINRYQICVKLRSGNIVFIC